MQSRTLLNLGLLLLVALLALLVVYEPGKAPEAPPPPITALERATIARIAVDGPGREPIRLERDEHGWQMRAPLALPANEFLVNQLLRLAEATSHTSLAGVPDLAPYGLIEPELTVALDETVFRFGDVQPLTGRRYVLVDGVVHLIEDDTYYLLRDGLSLASTQLLAPGTEIEAIRLPDGSTATRAQDGSWTMTSAGGDDRSQDAVHRLVDEWLYARAYQLERGATEPGDHPEVVLNLRGVDQPARFMVIESDSELVLGRADLGVRYRLPGEAAGRLLSLGQD